MIKKFLPVFLLFVLLIGGVGFWLMSPHHKITHYELASELKQVNNSQLEQIMSSYIGQSFWQIDLERLHAQIVRLDWVNTAEVRRKWPDGVEITLEEQKPSVRWGTDALLNQAGEIFYPQSLTGFEHYPQIVGPETDSKKLLAVYQTLRDSVKALGWSVARLTQLNDGAYKIDFKDAGVLVLPQEKWRQKLSLFLRAYEQIPPDLRKSAIRYDLRYSNGFVIKRAPQSAPNSQDHGT